VAEKQAGRLVRYARCVGVEAITPPGGFLMDKKRLIFYNRAL
jgi:hypothetical protein